MSGWKRVDRNGRLASHWVLVTPDGTYSIWQRAEGGGHCRKRVVWFVLIGPHGLRQRFDRAGEAKAHVAVLRGEAA